jgi:hypothetical protein
MKKIVLKITQSHPRRNTWGTVKPVERVKTSKRVYRRQDTNMRTYVKESGNDR